ncbi:MAG: CoA ester lyase, partial [Magnetococcales bacterium]|nr:CoA ester lyase [Magnetococcales bacterium]
MVKSSFALMRSALYIPGSNPRAIAKAAQLQADAVIFDLEDSVAPAAKEEARQTICQTLAGLERGKTLWAVRINSIGSDYWREDLLSILPAQPDALVIPKVHSASQLESLQPIL